MNKEMLTTDDLAEYLQIHKNQIYRMIKGRRLPATRVTGKCAYSGQVVQRFRSKLSAYSGDVVHTIGAKRRWLLTS